MSVRPRFRVLEEVDLIPDDAACLLRLHLVANRG